MLRTVVLALVGLALWLTAAAAPAAARDRWPVFRPGAAGIGDPYFPLDGNGGYDVQHYGLDVAYDPPSDVLTGEATITARATQHLLSFHLDLDGLEVRSVEVAGRPARWRREGAELIVTPRRGVERGRLFATVVRYDGVPSTIMDEFGASGFIHTDDGALVVGQPHVAATWFPVNDHPIDKAAYTFRVTVPAGLEAVANGALVSQATADGRTTWVWDAPEPMASYLATATIGEFDLSAYEEGGIRFWDALDPDLFDPPVDPRTGEGLAVSQAANASYKRLTRTIAVPDGGAELSFWVRRDTEEGFDFAFVEARTAGGDDWTTLPDANGHTSRATGPGCPAWHAVHPFLTRYQTATGDTCDPAGSSGVWHAATSASDGFEQWAVDLSAYAGGEVEVSIAYASDNAVQGPGVVVDDVEVSTGEGTTSFEPDGDTLDGWTVPGPPEGSPGNANDWIAGAVADAVPSTGTIARGSLARQGEIIAFLAGYFGPYPFATAGGIVDDAEELGFALENQTRPIYARSFFTDSLSGDNVVVHELAHQWFGDSLALERWQHIWLNEGFAIYAEWLWAEREGLTTVQQIFDATYAGIPPDDPFWALRIGDPGPGGLFDPPVYVRGAMTLHRLRLAIGDADFFALVREWARTQAGGNVTTEEFVALAERVSGQSLDALFTAWLFTPGRPVLADVAVAAAPLAARAVPLKQPRR
jgi:hypothetical protein